MIMMVFGSVAVAGVLWTLFGFSAVFGDSYGGLGPLGAVADRIRFGPWLLFAGLWATLVHFPAAHWVFAFDSADGSVLSGWIANKLAAGNSASIVMLTTFNATCAAIRRRVRAARQADDRRARGARLLVAVTWVIALTLQKTTGLRLPAGKEAEGVDLVEHAEVAYDLEGKPGTPESAPAPAPSLAPVS
jgi:ammonia channel protein AmtB